MRASTPYVFRSAKESEVNFCANAASIGACQQTKGHRRAGEAAVASRPALRVDELERPCEALQEHQWLDLLTR